MESEIVLKNFLDAQYEKYAVLEFIEEDPIQIPYQFKKQQDVEIAGFFAAIFAWGRRDIIINKTTLLMELMDHAPFDFIKNASSTELQKLIDFKHRTFQFIDLEYFLKCFQLHFQKYDSLEYAFGGSLFTNEADIFNHLNYFNNYLKALFPIPDRTIKHIPNPAKGAAAKRLCMYLRWMTRKDAIDFGIWKTILTNQLVIPLDVHVINTAIKLNIIEDNEKPNWNTAIKITNFLKQLDPIDPVKYDLALFGMGIERGKK